MNDTRFETGRKFILRNKLDYLIEKESIFENWSRYTEEEELKNNLMHVSIEGYLLPFLFSFFPISENSLKYLCDKGHN